MSSDAIPHFDHRSVFKGTAYLMVGNVVGQMVSLLGLLLLSRFYAPEGLGLWAMFLGVGFMVPLLAGLRYDLAVIIVDDEQDARHLIVLSLGLSCLCAVAVWMLIGLIEIVNPSLIPEMWKHIAIAYIPYIVGNGLINAATGWAVRNKYFRWLMTFRATFAVLTLALHLLFKDLTIFGNGLILGTVVACALTAIWSMILLSQPLRQVLATTENFGHLWQRLLFLAKREKSFPFFSVPYAVVGNFANQAVVIALGGWYSLATVGFFNMAYRTLYAPLTLIGSALGQAIMPSLAAAKHNIKAYEGTMTMIIRFMGWLYLPPLMLIIERGPAIYNFVFGASWEGAGVYAGFLIFGVFGAALTLWLERIFDILGRQRQHLAISILLNGLCLVMYVTTHFLFDDPTLTVLAWSLGMLLYAVIWLIIVYRLCAYSLRALLLTMLELFGLAAFLHFAVSLCIAMPLFLEEMAGLTVLFTAYGFVAYKRLSPSFLAMLHKKAAPVHVEGISA